MHSFTYLLYCVFLGFFWCQMRWITAASYIIYKAKDIHTEHTHTQVHVLQLIRLLSESDKG